MTVAIFLRAAFGLACAAGVTAYAAPQATVPLPATAGEAVPATRYQPVLPYHPAPAAAASPDRNWKALNATVGAYNSMALTMGGMDETTQDEPAQKAADGTGAAATTPTPAPAPAAPPATHHHHHHEAGQ